MENEKLITLNNKASIDNGIVDFFIPSQIKQKLFIIMIDTEFPEHSINIQYKYHNISVKQ
jgi:hypothetical protein